MSKPPVIADIVGTEETGLSRPVPPRSQERRPQPRLIGLRDAAAYLGVSYWTLRELINSGRVPTVRLESPWTKDGRSMRRVLLDRQDLDRLIDGAKEVERE